MCSTLWFDGLPPLAGGARRDDAHHLITSPRRNAGMEKLAHPAALGARRFGNVGCLEFGLFYFAQNINRPGLASSSMYVLPRNSVNRRSCVVTRSAMMTRMRAVMVGGFISETPGS